MKKFLASKTAEYIALVICIGVPTFLMWHFGLTTAFSVAILSFVLVATISELKKAKIIHYAPLVAYILMVVYYQCLLFL